MASKTGHRQLDHTADLALEIWGPDETAVLHEGMRALVAILTDDVTVGGDDERTIVLETLDPADRLVQWLNEVLYLATVEGFAADRAELELYEGGLRARLRGRADGADLLTTEIKSATYHDLALDHTDAGVVARVVLDV